MKTQTINDGITVYYGKNEIRIEKNFKNRDDKSKFFNGLMSFQLILDKSKIFMIIDGNYQGPKELDYDVKKSKKENLEFYLQKVLSFLETI